MSDPVAAADQTEAELRTQARLIGAFYSELIANQVPMDEAGWLCRDLFNVYLEGLSGV